jgi:hypothetical protein
VVVALEQLEAPAAHAARRVDLGDGQPGGASHRLADRIGERAGHADADRLDIAAARGSQKEGEQGAGAGRSGAGHEAGR